MESNERYYRRRAIEERMAAQRAMTEQARTWHSKLAEDFAQALHELLAPHPDLREQFHITNTAYGRITSAFAISPRASRRASTKVSRSSRQARARPVGMAMAARRWTGR